MPLQARNLIANLLVRVIDAMDLLKFHSAGFEDGRLEATLTGLCLMSGLNEAFQKSTDLFVGPASPTAILIIVIVVNIDDLSGLGCWPGVLP